MKDYYKSILEIITGKKSVRDSKKGMRFISDNSEKFLTAMERLRRDVLQRKRGMAGDTQTTASVQQLLNVAIVNNFKYVHLVSIRRLYETRFDQNQTP